MDMNIIFSIVGSTVSILVFVFMNFATKKELEKIEDDLKDVKGEIDKRLERIEAKIDRLIMK